MKRIINVAIIALFLTLASITALSADLRNEDGKRYEVKVHDGGTTLNTWIEANATTLSICGSCEVEVVGGRKNEDQWLGQVEHKRRQAH
jgi:hypothetical protein